MSRQQPTQSLYSTGRSQRTRIPAPFLLALPLICGFLVIIWEWLAIFYLMIAIGIYICGTQEHTSLGVTIPRFPAGSMVLAIALGIGMVSLVAYLSTPDQQTMYVPDLAVPYQQYAGLNTSRAASLASQGLIATIEEMFFRGYLMSALAPYTAIVAIPVSSIIFSAAHILTGTYIATLIGGLIFGCLAWGTRSILPSIMAHATYNVVVLAVAYQLVAAAALVPLTLIVGIVGGLILGVEYANKKGILT